MNGLGRAPERAIIHGASVRGVLLKGVVGVIQRLRAPRRSAFVVVLAVLACLVGLGSAPAQGAVALSGSVVFPAEYRSGQGALYVEVRDPDEINAPLRQTTVTRVAPSFAFSGLADGNEYVLVVWDNSGQLDSGILVDRESGRLSWEDGQPVLLGASTSGIELRPMMRPFIEGKVVDPPGFTAVAATESVIAWERSAEGHLGPGREEAYVAEDGSFRIVGLERDTRYQLEFEHSRVGLLEGWYSSERVGLVLRQADATTVETGASVVLRPRETATMSGRVSVAAGMKPGGLRVAIWPEDVRVDSSYYRDHRAAGNVTTRADGTFRADHLDPEAAYTVGVEVPQVGGSRVLQYRGEDGMPTTLREAAVALRPREGLRLAVASTSVRGSVIVPAGSPEQVDVEVRRETRDWQLARPAADGSFVVDGLMPGELVKLRVDAYPSKWADGWYAGVGVPVTPDEDRAETVLAGTSDLTLHLTDPRIVGRVDVSETFVGDPGDLYVSATRKDRYGLGKVEARVDGDGSFSVPTGDTHGSYVLSLRAASDGVRGGYLAPSGLLVPNEEDAQRFEVGTPGPVLPVDPVGSISVDVSLPESSSWTGEESVQATDPAGVVVASATWRRGQPAVLHGLAAGSDYAIQVEGVGLATAWYAGEGVPSVALRSEAALVRPGEAVTVQGMEAGSIGGRFFSALDDEPATIELLDAESGELVLRTRQYDTYLRGLSHVVPGTYVLGLQRADGSSRLAAGFVGPGGDWVADRADGALLTVRAGTTTRIDARPTTCATYSGVIDEPFDGSAATLRLWGDELPERSWRGAAGTDAFAVTGLSPGTYHVGLRIGWAAERTYDDVTIAGCSDVGGVRLGSAPRIRASSAPSLSGGDQVDDVVTVEPGSWEPAASSLDYQWFSGEHEITGATSGSYRLRPGDLGRTVSVRLTAAAAGVRSTDVTLTTSGKVVRAALGAAVAHVPSTAQVGTAIRASVTGWPGSTLEWQWHRDGWPIAGATAATYTPVPADEGRAVSVVAYGARPGYESDSAVSAAVRPRLVFAAVSPPQLSTLVEVGMRVTATRGVWTAPPDAVTYQWLRNGAAVGGATKSYYTPLPSDQGKMLQVRVTASLAGHPARSALSGKRLVEMGRVRSVSAPSVLGTVRVGHTLAADPGLWNPRTVTLRYRWLREGIAITGATSRSYVPVAADRGKRLHVRVTATKSGYRTGVAVSAATRPVP